MGIPSNPVAAMAGAYIAAFEQGARLWSQQAQAWRDAFARGAGWPLSGGGAAFPIGPSLAEMGAAWLDPVSVQLVEMEDRVAMSATCGDVRIDMMITRLPDPEAEKAVTLEGVAERIEAIRPKLGGA